MEEPARHDLGCAPGQTELVGKRRAAVSAAQWPVFLWQKREMSVEKETHSNCLEEEVVPTKVEVSLAGTYIARSTGKMG